jgi:predicted DNA-binding WGR domain protein
LVEDNDSSKNYVWNRWGRVGVSGQNALKGPMTLGDSIAEYDSKLKEKIQNGSYVKIEINNENEENKETKQSL